MKLKVRATILKDVDIDGVRRHRVGDEMDIKGFYYAGPRDKWIVMVGGVMNGRSIRMRVPADSVEIKVEEDKDDKSVTPEKGL